MGIITSRLPGEAMPRPEIIKILNAANITDGLLRNFALQENRNDKAVLDAIDAAVKRRVEQIDRLGEIVLMIERGEV